MFRIEDKSNSSAGAIMDAEHSSHFSRYFNHAQHGNLDVTVNELERRIDFVASARISEGDEMVFDYGMKYWRSRDGPLPSSDGRDYSEAAWAQRDSEEQWLVQNVPSSELSRRFPLPRGTQLPLTPLRPAELQAALILEEAQCREVGPTARELSEAAAHGCALHWRRPITLSQRGYQRTILAQDCGAHRH